MWAERIFYGGRDLMQVRRALPRNLLKVDESTFLCTYKKRIKESTFPADSRRLANTKGRSKAPPKTVQAGTSRAKDLDGKTWQM